MSIIMTKIKNNPSCFSNQSKFVETLSSFSMDNTNEKTTRINPPQKKQHFSYGGFSGIPLAYDSQRRKVFVDQTDKHSLIIGSTASKKSRLLAMPSIRLLGLAKESMIISDPKSELYERTSAYLLSNGYKVSILNLREPHRGNAWNPLHVAYNFFKLGDIDKAYEFANDIATNLAGISKSEKDPFWDESAGSFMFGLILLLFKYCSEHNVKESAVNIANVINLREVLCKGTRQDILNNPLWKYAKEDNFIASTLIGTVETGNDTRASILSVFDQKMRTFAIQPSLLDMLSYNDIELDIISEQPVAIYLVLPDEKTGYHSLVSLFVKQSYEYLIYQAQKNTQKANSINNRVNYILDEFSSLPTIKDFPAMITAARSRNIRFNLYLQSKHQLLLRYREESDTIMSNCENWIFLTSRELTLLKELSDLCGTISNSIKPLLTITDLQRLDKELGEVLILSGRNKPLATNLADIEDYDNNRFIRALYPEVNREQYETIDYLSKIRHIHKNENMQISLATILNKLSKDGPDSLSPNDNVLLEQFLNSKLIIEENGEIL